MCLAEGKKWMATNKERLVRFLFVIWIPILCMLMVGLQGHRLLDIYLPAGWCSDEVSYYKQIEAILEYGIPKGYWGYNESTAQFGTFGPWVVLSYIPYIILGKIIGWNFATPVICNLLLMVVASWIYVKITDEEISQFLWLMALETVMLWVTRYTISGMLEPWVMALELILLGLLRSERYGVGKRNVWIYIVVYLLGLVRPYFIVLFFLPCFVAEKNKKKYAAISTIMVVLSAAQYLIYRKLFCAAYITASVLDAGFNIKELIKGGINAVQLVIDLLIHGGATYGYGYALMFLTLVLGVIKIFIKFKKYKKAEAHLLIDAWAVFSVLATLGAVLLLYDPYAGSRHVWQVSLFAMFVLISDDKFFWAVKTALIALSIIILCIYMGESTYLRQVPYKQEALEKIATGTELSILFEPVEDDRWANTLAINASEVDYNYVYYLPSYMGVQIVWSDWLEGAMENMNSRYVFTGYNGAIAERLRENGWIILYEDAENNLCILERP
ncbi:MAG: hypothetical protein IJX66_06785 [Lachnospiraceae bacterium]|nr:hypothetical protein [Lachnospiraceae bacterium]